jgi:hypothetical protein
MNLFAVCDLYEEELGVQEGAICALTRKLLGTTDSYKQNRRQLTCNIFLPSREKRP